jgi:hypothetical protein
VTLCESNWLLMAVSGRWRLPTLPSRLPSKTPHRTYAHAAIRRCTSLGYEKSEAGLRCLARSLEARLTWVNVMRLVSDKASRLSVHTPFREVPCTDSCTRQSSGAVLQTAAAQVSLCPVTCDDVRKLDLRLCRVPRMSHTLGIGDPVRCGPQGRSAIRRAPGAVIGLDSAAGLSA